MATVIVHATVPLDGFLADPDGGVDWMFGRPSAPEDDVVVTGHGSDWRRRRRCEPVPDDRG